MSNYNVSSRYARALIDTATDNNIFNKVTSDVVLVYNSLKDSKELRKVLASPIIKEVKKIEILSEIFQDKISKDTLNFIRFIVSKNRENMLIDIMRRFLDIKNEKLGIIEVDVVSSHELNEEQKSVLKKQLKEKTSKEVLLSYRIDESIIGGFKLKLNDTVIDASVQNQLVQLRKVFLDENMISTN